MIRTRTDMEMTYHMCWIFVDGGGGGNDGGGDGIRFSYFKSTMVFEP